MEHRYTFSYMINNTCIRVFFILLLLLFGICNQRTYAQSVTFHQLNFNYDGTITSNSDWGGVDLTFTGSPGLLYFNLSRDTGYVIENMPVQTLGNIGVLQTQRFWFPIGLNGVPVTTLTYGFTLTPAPAGRPLVSSGATVSPDFVIILTGGTVGTGGGDNHPPPAKKQKGGVAVQPPQQHKNFPNQEAGVNECVPVGISNSLQFLNTKNGLGMKAADIGIPSLKNGTGWGPGGCPRPGWVENKKNYVKAKKLPITTRKLGGPANIKKIGAEIAAGQDVEMDIKWKGTGAHCVCVTGWVDLGNGKYKITITHDSKQGQAGGTVSETATYDSNTGKWDGALVNGTKDFFFVVECPIVKVRKNTLPSNPTGSGYHDKTNGGSSHENGKYELKNVMISNITTSDPLPPLGNTVTTTFEGMADFNFSADSGMTFIHLTGPVNIMQLTSHTLDSAGVQYYPAEFLAMDMMSGPLMIRESPTLQSTGLMRVDLIQNAWRINSFFDVFFDISIDGGATWLPSTSGSSLLELNTQSAGFKQLNFNYEGTLTDFSDWGALDLTFPGTAEIQYLNLSVNGNWAIQNMPVQSLGKTDLLQTQRFWFPIGPRGAPVEALNYGYSLTPSILGMPETSDFSPVDQDWVILFSGDLANFGTGDNHPPLASVQIGGAIAQAGFNHKGFPNQEAGVNECVPVGISNSLQFLNAKHGLGMPAAPIGIPALKGGTGWGPNGCPRPGWVENKKNYVKNNKLPITTRKLPGPANIANIGAEIAAGQDVEMDIKWKGPGAHCVSVTGWVDLGNGKYKITITHDSKQGQAGGTVSESAIYDSNTGTWTGALANGTNDFFFVVECPPVTINQPAPTIPSGSLIRYKPHSGTYFNAGMYQVQNLQLSDFSNTIPPPPQGGTEFLSFQCLASLQISLDHGLTTTDWTGMGQVVVRVTRQPDMYAMEIIETEILAMNLVGAPLPEGAMIRESPTLPSIGQTTINQLPGGIYLIHSFFDIFTELSMDGGASWFEPDGPDTPGSTLLEIDGPVIPAIREVQNVTVGDGEYNCLDATQTLQIAGDGTTYHVLSGGNVTMIAGQNILIYPDTKVDLGGYLNAFISTNGEYCGSLRSSVVTIPPPVYSEVTINPETTSNTFFRCYPNPTAGSFILEVSGVPESSKIIAEIYGIPGRKILRAELSGSSRHVFDLSGEQHGVYLIRVISGNETGIMKIIKQ